MSRQSITRLLVPALVAVVALLAADVALACPNCKDSIAHSDPTASGLMQGYFWSILFMLSMPFTLLTAMCVYFYLLVRRARATQTGKSTPALSPESLVAHSSLPRWNPSMQ